MSTSPTRTSRLATGQADLKASIVITASGQLNPFFFGHVALLDFEEYDAFAEIRH